MPEGAEIGDEYPSDIFEMLKNSAQPEIVDLHCSNCKKSQKFLKSTHQKTWPLYLFIKVNRFIFKDWVPKKSHALINIPID